MLIETKTKKFWSVIVIAIDGFIDTFNTYTRCDYNSPFYTHPTEFYNPLIYFDSLTKKKKKTKLAINTQT